MNDKNFNNYNWKEGIGAAIYAICALLLLVGAIIGFVVSLIK